jgi:hypothetical protein
MRKKKISAILLAGAFALSVPAAAAADPPHAGNSGKFKGSSEPCHKKDTGNPHCPPHGS